MYLRRSEGLEHFNTWIIKEVHLDCYFVRNEAGEQRQESCGHMSTPQAGR